MDKLMELIDNLSDEELLKLNSHLDNLEKTAEARVHAINSGRFMAKEFMKHASFLFTKMDDGLKKTASLESSLKKVASLGKSPYSFLFNCEYPEEPDLEKLANADHYYRYGGAAIATFLGVFN